MSQTDMFKLDGKVVMIPGGSGGIGSALAAGVCEAGAVVAIIDRDGDGRSDVLLVQPEKNRKKAETPPVRLDPALLRWRGYRCGSPRDARR